MEITLAKSKAGHDKNHVYVIIGTEQDLVYLANGRTKTCEHPKKKKIKHIQPIRHLPVEIIGLAQNQELDDALVNIILDLYNRRKQDV